MGYIDDLLTDGINFSAGQGEGVEYWLSSFLEDCFTGKSCENATLVSHAGKKPAAENPAPSPSKEGSLNQAKERSKRKRPTLVSTLDHNEPSKTIDLEEEDFEAYDPPLLDQAYWLADSELIILHKNPTVEKETKGDYGRQEEDRIKEVLDVGGAGGAAGQQQPRRCSHCLAQRTLQWRAGPLGPKTLCNACGVRFKTGRLLPEYRPAKSPTFVSYKHSNSHKKVMEMRMSTSINASQYQNH